MTSHVDERRRSGHGELSRGDAVMGRCVIDRCLRRDRLASVFLAKGSAGAAESYLVWMAHTAPLLRSQHAVTVFTREMERAGAVHQRGLPRVVAVDAESAAPTVLFERHEGVTLRDRIGQEGALSAATVARVVLQAAASLEALHSVNPPVLHRTLSPERVVLSNDDDAVWIEESGCLHALVTAGFITDRTAMSHAQPGYLLPDELALPPTPASDAFSLAVLAFESLTGQLPFGAANPMDLAVLLRTRAAPKVSAFRDGDGAYVDEVIERAFGVLRGTGYATPREFARDLVRTLLPLEAELSLLPSYLPAPLAHHDDEVAIDPEPTPSYGEFGAILAKIDSDRAPKPDVDATVPAPPMELTPSEAAPPVVDIVSEKRTLPGGTLPVGAPIDPSRARPHTIPPAPRAKVLDHGAELTPLVTYHSLVADELRREATPSMEPVDALHPPLVRDVRPEPSSRHARVADESVELSVSDLELLPDGTVSRVSEVLPANASPSTPLQPSVEAVPDERLRLLAEEDDDSSSQVMVVTENDPGLALVSSNDPVPAAPPTVLRASTPAQPQRAPGQRQPSVPPAGRAESKPAPGQKQPSVPPAGRAESKPAPGQKQASIPPAGKSTTKTTSARPGAEVRASGAMPPVSRADVTAPTPAVSAAPSVPPRSPVVMASYVLAGATVLATLVSAGLQVMLMPRIDALREEIARRPVIVEGETPDDAGAVTAPAAVDAAVRASEPVDVPVATVTTPDVPVVTTVGPDVRVAVVVAPVDAGALAEPFDGGLAPVHHHTPTPVVTVVDAAVAPPPPRPVEDVVVVTTPEPPPERDAAVATHEPPTSEPVDSSVQQGPPTERVRLRLYASLRPQVADCVEGMEPGQRVTMEVRFNGPTGTVSQLHLHGIFAEPPIGPCIEQAVRGLTVTPFSTAYWEPTFVFPVAAPRWSPSGN